MDTKTKTMAMTMTTTPAAMTHGPPEAGAAPSSRAQARLRRAMTMAALAAILALGGVFGLQPRVAEATPRTLPRTAAAAAAGTRPSAGPATAPDTPAHAGATDEPEPTEPDEDPGGSAAVRGGKRVTGRLNLNTATAAELMLLPGIGPAKAERVLTWRKRNGTFRRVVDLRRVKGFGYRTVKRLEPNLDVKGDTTLRAGP